MKLVTSSNAALDPRFYRIPKLDADFAEIDRTFQFIESQTDSVVIESQLPEELRTCLRNEQALPSRVFRRLQSYSVQVYRWEREAMEQAGRLECLHDCVYLLSGGLGYAEDTGLDVRMADGISAGGGEAGGCVDDGRAAVQLVFDASNPNNAGTGAGYLQNILTAGETAATPDVRMLYNPQMESAYNFVPGIMGLIFMLICALMTSVSIVREKESGTMEVLLVSPVRPLRIVVAKMLPYFGLSCLDLATILLMARYVLGIPMTGSIAGIVGISVLYLTLALALGLFISTITQRQITALLCSAMLMLIPLIMLSGMVFPIENMPGILRGLSCIIPARWYIDAIRKLMIEGLPFAAVLDDFAILAAMTAVLIGVALKKFKDRLE